MRTPVIAIDRAAFASQIAMADAIEFYVSMGTSSGSKTASARRVSATRSASARARFKSSMTPAARSGSLLMSMSQSTMPSL